MATFEDIAKVNEGLEKVDIKGKMYAPVNERVMAFRKLYPEGFIKTEVLSNTGGVCVIQATAGYYDESGAERTLGSGIAYERENSNYINRTSYIENCETSALGRCLGSIGLGVNAEYASANEVISAIDQQEEIERKKKAQQNSTKTTAANDNYATEADVNQIIQLCNKAGISPADLCKICDVTGSKLTKGDYAKMRKYLDSILDGAATE